MIGVRAAVYRVPKEGRNTIVKPIASRVVSVVLLTISWSMMSCGPCSDQDDVAVEWDACSVPCVPAGDWSASLNWNPLVVPYPDNDDCRVFDVTISQMNAVVRLDVSPEVDTVVMANTTELEVSAESGFDSVLRVNERLTNNGTIVVADDLELTVDTPVLDMQSQSPLGVEGSLIARTFRGGAGSVATIRRAEIVGGTLVTSGDNSEIRLVDGVILDGVSIERAGQGGNQRAAQFSAVITDVVKVPANEVISFKGTIDNNGVVIVDSDTSRATLYGLGATTILQSSLGIGCVVLTGASSTLAGETVTQMNGHSIIGAGKIRITDLTNDGVINANVPGQILSITTDINQGPAGMLWASNGIMELDGSDVEGTGRLNVTGLGALLLKNARLRVSTCMDVIPELVSHGGTQVELITSFITVDPMSTDPVSTIGGTVTLQAGSEWTSGSIDICCAPDLSNGCPGPGGSAEVCDDPTDTDSEPQARLAIVDTASSVVTDTLTLLKNAQLEVNGQLTIGSGLVMTNTDHSELEWGSDSMLIINGQATVEVGSADDACDGSSGIGFEDSFSIPRLRVEEGATVTFVNDHDNDEMVPTDGSPDVEVIYIQDLQLRGSGTDPQLRCKENVTVYVQKINGEPVNTASCLALDATLCPPP
jgi:hypothetical protein